MTRTLPLGYFDSTPGPSQSRFIAAKRAINVGQKRGDVQVVRINLGGALEQRRCLLDFSLAVAKSAVKIMRFERTRIECDSSLKFCNGFVGPVSKQQCKPAGGMHLRQRLVKRKEIGRASCREGVERGGGGGCGEEGREGDGRGKGEEARDGRGGHYHRESHPERRYFFFKQKTAYEIHR